MFWRNTLLPSSKQKRWGEYKPPTIQYSVLIQKTKMWTILTALCTILIECGTRIKQSVFPYTECNGTYTYCHVTSEVVSDEGQNTYVCPQTAHPCGPVSSSRASFRRLNTLSKEMYQVDATIYYDFILINSLYMFRTFTCPSSGVLIYRLFTAACGVTPCEKHD